MGIPLVPRTRHIQRVEHLLEHNPVVSILGARQVGKTTLAMQILQRRRGRGVRFDLEDPDDLARLDEPNGAPSYSPFCACWSTKGRRLLGGICSG